MLPLWADAPPVYVAAAPFIEGEVFVGAEIINPQFGRLGFFSCGLAIEEEHVGYSASPARTALSVEDAGRQSKQGVNVRLLE